MQHWQATFEQCYEECQRTLTQISYDYANDREFCIGDDKYIDLDCVAKKYFTGTNKPSTVDMLAFGNEHVLLIEFKAGKHVKTEKHSLQFKLLTSLLLYERLVAQIFNPSSKELVKTKFVYLVVFDPILCPSSHAKQTSRTVFIQNHLQKVQVRFGIDKYKSIFLEEAFTLECGEEFRTVLAKFGVRQIQKINYPRRWG
jgi:hypothetical protein